MLKKIITKKNSKKSRAINWETLLAIFITAIFTGLIIFKISPSMDEFLPYHQLACIVNKTQSLFRESCTQHNLILFGKSMQLRSFTYVGFSNSILYLPFYLIWKSYLSARVLKLIFLVATAIISAKIVKADWKIALLITCCFFPFSFQMLVDTGPIAFQCLTIVVLIYIFSKIKNGLAEGLMAGIIAFFAVEQKLFFLPFLLPTFVYALIVFGDKKNIVKYVKFFSTLILVVGLGVFLLLTAKTEQGISYYSELFGRFSQIGIFDFRGQAEHFSIFKPFFSSFYNFAERITDTSAVFDFSTFYFYLILSLVAVSSFYIMTKNKQKDELKKATAGILALILGMFLLSLSKESARAHHLAIILPFFLLLLLSSISILQEKRKILGYAAVIFLILPNLLILNRTINLTPYSQDDWSRLELIKFVNNMESKNAFVVTDWGIYYLLALYAKPSTPVYFEDLNSKNISISIDELSRNGYLIFALGKSRPISNFYNLTEIKYNDKNNNWHLYKLNENYR